MYRFKVGERVVHREYPSIVGRITELLTQDEGTPKHEQNPDDPWYHISWPNFKGFEHDGKLISTKDLI